MSEIARLQAENARLLELLTLKDDQLKQAEEKLKRQEALLHGLQTHWENLHTKVKAVQEANPQLSFKEAAFSLLDTP